MVRQGLYMHKLFNLRQQLLSSILWKQIGLNVVILVILKGFLAFYSILFIMNNSLWYASLLNSFPMFFFQYRVSLFSTMDVKQNIWHII